jgi:hypothetical protein
MRIKALKKKSMKKGDLYFLGKNTCILITMHCILTFVRSPREKSLMDSKFYSKKDPATVLLFKNQQSFWQQHCSHFLKRFLALIHQMVHFLAISFSFRVCFLALAYRIVCFLALSIFLLSARFLALMP